MAAADGGTRIGSTPDAAARSGEAASAAAAVGDPSPAAARNGATTSVPPSGLGHASSSRNVRQGVAALRGAVAASRRHSTGSVAGGRASLSSVRSGRAPLRLREAVALAANVEAEAEQPAKKKYGQTAFDMGGREHDLTELRERRNVAVRKGLRKMFKFFKKDGYAALHEIGDDAPSIFFECWYASSSAGMLAHRPQPTALAFPRRRTLYPSSTLVSGTPPPTLRFGWRRATCASCSCRCTKPGC